MKVKLDENLGVRGQTLLRAAGFDVTTVVEQGLGSASDETLVEICRVEGRGVVTLDKDFANTLRFPPRRFAGIAVLRLPEPFRLADLETALRLFVEVHKEREFRRHLWIVETHRVREYADETLVEEEGA